MKYNKKEVTNIIILVAFVVAAFFLLRHWRINVPAPSTPPAPDETIDQVPTDLNSQREAAQSVNRFAFDLYSLYRRDQGNVFFSPYSITTALAMTYEGARGETAKEMERVFYLPSEEVRRPGFAGLYQQINPNDADYELSTANALWPEQNYHFEESYLNLIERYYRSKVSRLNFREQAEESRLTINRWVEERTRDKIRDLIPAGVIDPSTRLVLTNAIYFKGSWLREFDPDLTQTDRFNLSNGESVEAPMMRRTDEEAVFDYFEDEDVQVISLPYKGEELAMMILLPGEGKISEFEEALSYEKITGYREMLTERRVDLFLPRFRFETKYFMADDLAEMGMPLAFSGEADFSGMTGRRDLFIDSVIHQAFVEVNEEGTEAAAATGVIMVETAMADLPVFRADRPFIFLIEHLETGAILFMGRVSNPA